MAMGKWPDILLDRCAGLPNAAISEGAFGDGAAVWVGKREVAHFDDESTLDVRLTKPLIRAYRSEFRQDERVRLRSGSSDWLEVRITNEADMNFALQLVREAVQANLPTAPPGSPPSGAELARRRRFH